MKKVSKKESKRLASISETLKTVDKDILVNYAKDNGQIGDVYTLCNLYNEEGIICEEKWDKMMIDNGLADRLDGCLEM